MRQILVDTSMVVALALEAANALLLLPHKNPMRGELNNVVVNSFCTPGLKSVPVSRHVPSVHYLRQYR
jgi:hypothetical protein